MFNGEMLQVVERLRNAEKRREGSEESSALDADRARLLLAVAERIAKGEVHCACCHSHGPQP